MGHLSPRVECPLDRGWIIALTRRMLACEYPLTDTGLTVMTGGDRHYGHAGA
jgi:hypothetical protein